MTSTPLPPSTRRETGRRDTMVGLAVLWAGPALAFILAIAWRW